MRKIIFMLSFVFALGANANTSQPVFDVSTDHDQFENVDAISMDVTFEAASVVSVSPMLTSVSAFNIDNLAGASLFVTPEPLKVQFKSLFIGPYDYGPNGLNETLNFNTEGKTKTVLFGWTYLLHLFIR